MAILVQQSEVTAALRRMFFHCVDATDGMAPETGEAGGQPQISLNGAAWGNTTGVLVAIGNGRYYVELVAATEVNSLGIIEGRYKSGETAESIGTTLQVVPFDPYDGVRLGLTALPNAAADASGGLPISDDGGLDLDAMSVQLDDNFDEILNVKTQTDKFIFTVANQVNANIIGISSDNTAADNLEAQYDGTGYAGGTIKQDVKIVSASQTALDAILKTTTFALAIADAIADEDISKSEHNVANSLAKKIRGIEHVTVLNEGTAQGAGGGNNTIELAETASDVNDWYKDDWVMLVEGTGENQMHHIESYVGLTRIATLGEDWITNPDNSTDYVIIAQSSVHVHRFEQDAKDEINAEADTALSDINLDHLMKVVVADRDVMAEVADGTVLANLMTKTDGDTSDFDPDTDSLEAIRDQSAQILTDTSAQDTATKLRTLLTGADTPVCKDSTPLSAANVNSEVVDALNVDTYAEPGQEAPAATTTLVKKIGYLYKFLRNKSTNDGTNIKVYNDAGAVVDQKNTVSEDGGTVTRGKFGSGP